MAQMAAWGAVPQILASQGGLAANIIQGEVRIGGDSNAEVQASILARAARSKLAKVERKAEKRSELAVDVRGARERVVHATQRLTLDRAFEVAVVEAAGLTSGRLAAAEKLLDVATVDWTPRYWFPIEVGALSQLDQDLEPLRDSIDDRRLSLLVHGEGGDPSLARELHRRACRDLSLEVGPTVLVGAGWRAPADFSVISLRATSRSERGSVALERRIDEAIGQRRYDEVVEDPMVEPLSLLVAIARSGDVTSGRREKVVADLLSRSSASVQYAWAVLESDRVMDPTVWEGHTREFVVLLMRGRGDAEIPLGSLPSDLLRETYFHDEILRLSPSPLLYGKLLALPKPVRSMLHLVDD